MITLCMFRFAEPSMPAELHYSFRATPWLTVRPNLQLLVHPGGSEEIKNAWVLGNQVTVKF